MTGFCSTSVYAATLEQFFREGGQPLEFKWYHGNHEPSNITFYSDGTVIGKSAYTGKGGVWSFSNSHIVIGGPGEDGKPRKPTKESPSLAYNEFPFPQMFGAPTPSSTGLYAKGGKQRLLRKLEIRVDQQDRIAALNHAATKRRAHEIWESGEGKGALADWELAESMISTSSEEAITPVRATTVRLPVKKTSKQKKTGLAQLQVRLLAVRHAKKLRDGTTHTWEATIINGKIEGGTLGQWNSPSGFALEHLRSIYPDYPSVNGWTDCEGYSAQGKWEKLDYFRTLTEEQLADYFEPE